MTSGYSSNPGVRMFSSPATEVEKPTFELVEQVKKNVWIVTRKGDPRREKYLASPSSPFGVKPDGTVDVAQTRREAEALNTLLSSHNQAYTIRQILNHENLVSIVGVIENWPFNKSQTSDVTPGSNVQMLVWDFGDAGNLSALFRHYPCKSSEFYLPESLCWHVLRSLIRAVTYLHDGKRLIYRPEQLGRHMVREWVSVNTDWFPILHRCIEPRNVWLQHPRGNETYGQCKLGDYSHAAVTCHIVDGQFNPDTVRSDSNGMALATKEGIWRLDDTRSAYDVPPASIPSEEDRPYTLGDELWSIGVTVFTMMTGQAPTYYCEGCGCSHVAFCEDGGCLEKEAVAKGCDCFLGGCEHVSQRECREEVSGWPSCPAWHNCSEFTINIHSYLARARYTKPLRAMIMVMLGYNPARGDDPWVRMVEVAQMVELAYGQWKQETEEGRLYVDAEDGMLQRATK
ncbi:hypothetical protein FOXG_06171 [Fusarium oxysporum f. sp. lycopersici 4287]|uniref:Protein kinase domain-containing protein n=3 Tax=Fusarium oxysporum TaxID=5507 RepID=A0A0J9UXB8_FUSO4|nr:hypothetical protein FOXG_06171 [Fusarium oxysporum f. sp. lycopersici 4287]XP_018241849.1 hypothetical protein FOXG_06171 [Fusarium oxysporum f. sp. lycopersici 4287]XP_018241850.1 hypothetical protein FOXG_06171 [Fusarium oxysporum f. sp. lycopersici 4287]EXK33381.1 hypothetical protein FOMG_12077 [Fusarium oxysporum f. sp. melonis 26406]KAJ9423364.1 hypothetical protein QL093DRAFT_2080308 [Fusarium oxysporum]EXK33382.1 hypothetical protein FOMG_12077 [Fusarium oxysporum f. sp. melonis 26